MKKRLLLTIPLIICLLFTLALPCFATSEISYSSQHNYSPISYSLNVYGEHRANTPYVSNKPTSYNSARVPLNSPVHDPLIISDTVSTYYVAHEYLEADSNATRTISGTSITAEANHPDFGDNTYSAFLTINPVLFYPKNNSIHYLPTLIDFSGFEHLGTNNTTRIKYTYLSKVSNQPVTQEYTRTSKRVLQSDNYLQSLHIAWADMCSDYLANSVADTPLSVETCYCYIPSLSYTLTPNRKIHSGVLLEDYYFGSAEPTIPSFTVKTPPSIVHTVEADFTSWIGNAVQGFWSFQIFPNITIGAIVLAILGLTLTLSFLKFFAGG